MYRALTEYKKRDARLAICRWNRHIPEKAPSFDPDFAYGVANPLVYHFHGCMPWAESAVVTEDDYFEFLINISRDYKSLAHRVDRALGGTLLFLGYTLSDWDFLVLFRLFANKLRDSGNTHIAVHREPSDTPGRESGEGREVSRFVFRQCTGKNLLGHLSAVLRGTASSMGSLQPGMSNSPFVGPQPFGKEDSGRFFESHRHS